MKESNIVLDNKYKESGFILPKAREKIQSKTGAILVLFLITVFGYSSQGEILFERKQASAYINISVTPKIREVFTVRYTFIPHMEAEEASYYPYVMKFTVNTYQEENAYKIIKGQLENKLTAIKKSEPTTYTISLMITKSVPMIQIGAGIPGHIAWTKFI